MSIRRAWLANALMLPINVRVDVLPRWQMDDDIVLKIEREGETLLIRTRMSNLREMKWKLCPASTRALDV